jgi:DNA-directed RNA polymerase specialized sigma24 family protein
MQELSCDIHHPKEREQLFLELYEDVFPKVATFIAHRGGSLQDAKDIFHDSLIIFYEKMVEGAGGIKHTNESYIVGIAKHLWIRKFKDERKKIGLDDIELIIFIPENFFESTDNKLISLLEVTGKKCLDLLRGFYYDNLGLTQLKEMFGFSTVHSVSVQKHKCVEKMRDVIEQKSLRYEDFQ